LIASHQSEQAIRIDQARAGDEEPAVASVALRSLFAIDPKQVLPVAEAALQGLDTNVRSVGIETYLLLPTKERLLTLSHKLNDPHPKLRGRVREGFFELSNDGTLEPTIRQSAIAILNGDDWRGQEQAALLLGALDEESIAPRLIDLLASSRPEVMVSAAWSLKAIEVPQTAAPVQAFAQERTTSGIVVNNAIDIQMAHLFELLGKLKAVEAIPLLEVYVPKTEKFGFNSRAAAIWSLGVIQEGQVNEPLAKKLLERFLDTLASPPEAFEVRRVSVLSLGRLRAKNRLPALRQALGEAVDQDWMELTIRHAITQISGEVIPVQPPVTLFRTGWFLEPSYRPRKNRDTTPKEN
jgi:HEAT repeat protein